MSWLKLANFNCVRRVRLHLWNNCVHVAVNTKTNTWLIEDPGPSEKVYFSCVSKEGLSVRAKVYNHIMTSMQGKSVPFGFCCTCTLQTVEFQGEWDIKHLFRHFVEWRTTKRAERNEHFSFILMWTITSADSEALWTRKPLSQRITWHLQGIIHFGKWIQCLNKMNRKCF